MPLRKPLVLADGQTQQLQIIDDLDIPLAERVEVLERTLTVLVTFLTQAGIELPDELTNLI